MNAKTAKDITDRARFHSGDWLHIEKRIEEAASHGLNRVEVDGGMHQAQVEYLKEKGFDVMHNIWAGKVYAIVSW